MTHDRKHESPDSAPASSATPASTKASSNKSSSTKLPSTATPSTSLPPLSPPQLSPVGEARRLMLAAGLGVAADLALSSVSSGLLPTTAPAALADDPVVDPKSVPGFTRPAAESFPNLYSWTDTCNVYLLRDGDAAILIDLGDGSI
ncbi:MAG TPA: hypothetical protein PLV92_24505, partial [Pirellulaceae bacterium]|nr:hypothetical protein [Pirellulaceae bacterium]